MTYRHYCSFSNLHLPTSVSVFTVRIVVDPKAIPCHLFLSLPFPIQLHWVTDAPTIERSAMASYQLSRTG